MILHSHVREDVDSCEEVLVSLQRLLSPNGKFGMEIDEDVYNNSLLSFDSRTYY
ncbi:MAG: hypothetical protein JSU77_11725 [Fidelibacterota bacterium]|nr:MAG: hypothetical protein JSU77_11725 [Candidatus Neomarinimicrobiota bacterium]